MIVRIAGSASIEAWSGAPRHHDLERCLESAIERFDFADVDTSPLFPLLFHVRADGSMPAASSPAGDASSNADAAADAADAGG
jgi:hypothetical protein